MENKDKQKWKELEEFINKKIDDCDFLLDVETDDVFYIQAIRVRQSMLYEIKRKMRELDSTKENEEKEM